MPQLPCQVPAKNHLSDVEVRTFHKWIEWPIDPRTGKKKLESPNEGELLYNVDQVSEKPCSCNYCKFDWGTYHMGLSIEPYDLTSSAGLPSMNTRMEWMYRAEDGIWKLDLNKVDNSLRSQHSIYDTTKTYVMRPTDIWSDEWGPDPMEEG